MSERRILYLSRADMDAVGPAPAELVELLAEGFRAKARGEVQQPPKHWIERSDQRFASAMSSYLPASGFLGCKWQTGDPANSARGLPYIQGLYLLSEDTFGTPVCIMDAEWITGYRTAAASALAVRELARPNAATLAILGCGLQGRAHLEALMAVMPQLARVQVFDVRADVAQVFARTLGARHGLAIEAMADARKAVAGADVVISAGPILNPPRPVIEADWLAPGVTGVTIDYDSYWTPGAMQAMQRIVTDDRSQIEHLKEHGLFLGVPRLDGELGDLLLGRLPGRERPQDRILCFNLGIALEDLVTAIEVYRRALDRKAGMVLAR